MKKKNYLRKAEKGVLIGTSALLLSGFVGCSDSPTDTMPENVLTKAGYPGQPEKPERPGLPGEPYYPAGSKPLLAEGVNACFNMSNGSCSFKTILPKGDKNIKITMYKETLLPREIHVSAVKSQMGHLPNAKWRQSAYFIDISSIRIDKVICDNGIDSIPNPEFGVRDSNIEIEVTLNSNDLKLLYLFVSYN